MYNYIYIYICIEREREIFMHILRNTAVDHSQDFARGRARPETAQESGTVSSRTKNLHTVNSGYGQYRFPYQGLGGLGFDSGVANSQSPC